MKITEIDFKKGKKYKDSQDNLIWEVDEYERDLFLQDGTDITEHFILNDIVNLDFVEVKENGLDNIEKKIDEINKDFYKIKRDIQKIVDSVVGLQDKMSELNALFDDFELAETFEEYEWKGEYYGNQRKKRKENAYSLWRY